MYVQHVEKLEDLQPYRRRWDELAGDCVFRSWTWLTTWWQYYGTACAQRQLHVLLVFDNDSPSPCGGKNNTSCSASIDDYPAENDPLIAILPCYLENSLVRGNVLRLLGDGETCSDHLDLLVAPSDIQRVVETLAGALSDRAADWDVADFSAVDVDSVALQRLFAKLEARHCHVSRVASQHCWSIQLPTSWDEYLAEHSKSHRKKLRRLERQVLDSERAVWHIVQSPEEFDAGWRILVDLHQRRRRSLGDPGCFASQQFASFHRDVARQLLAAGGLRLCWLALDGQPIAVEYNLASGKTTYGYQAGLDPERLAEEPGRLTMIRALQLAIAEGHDQFDLLRGDEPYKARWHATPHATHDVQVVPPRGAARWRWRSWTYLRRAGRYAREFANLLS